MRREGGRGGGHTDSCILIAASQTFRVTVVLSLSQFLEMEALKEENEKKLKEQQQLIEVSDLMRAQRIENLMLWLSC